jgi:hypothetical protein
VTARTKLPPGKRPNYVVPPKVAAAVSLSHTEAEALSKLLGGVLLERRQVPNRELAVAAAFLQRARKSLARAKAKRAVFEKERKG